MIEEKDLKIGDTYYVLIDNDIPKYKYQVREKRYCGMTYTVEKYKKGNLLNPIYFFINKNDIRDGKIPWSTDNLNLIFNDRLEASKYRTELLILCAHSLSLEIEYGAK